MISYCDHVIWLRFMVAYTVITCQILMLTSQILMSSCPIFIDMSLIYLLERTRSCPINAIQITIKLPAKSTKHLTIQHQYLTIRHQYLTSRHQYLKSWHNIFLCRLCRLVRSLWVFLMQFMKFCIQTDIQTPIHTTYFLVQFMKFFTFKHTFTQQIHEHIFIL